MEKKNPIEEAKRYLQNAKDVLKNNTTVDNDGYYSDSKYVRMAGNTAWNGCLIALDAAYDIKKDKKKDTRLSIDDYKRIISGKDKKMIPHVVEGYNLLHLSMGYDGTKRASVVKDGFALAKTIISRCSEKYQ